MWARTLSVCKDPSDFAYCVCEVYSTGYSQPNRKQISIERLEKGIARADCSSMVSWVLYMGGFLTECPWFYTAIERDYLKNRGWTELESGLFAPERNDVLWREGHTAIYIGHNLVAELIHDENWDAGWEGEQAGDQTGDESRLIQFKGYEWEYILRAPDSVRNPDKEDETVERKQEMTFLFRPNDDEKQPMMFYDGGFISVLANEDEEASVKEAYKKATGLDIPVISIGTKDAPYGTRFMAVVQRKWDLLDRFAEIGAKIDSLRALVLKVVNKMGAW